MAEQIPGGAYTSGGLRFGLLSSCISSLTAQHQYREVWKYQIWSVPKDSFLAGEDADTMLG